MIEDLPTEIYIFFKNTDFFELWHAIKKTLSQKIVNQASYLCAEFDADSKTLFLF